MKRHPGHQVPWRQSLIGDDLRSGHGLEDVQDDGLFGASYPNVVIALGARRYREREYLDLRPELVIAERVQPLLHIISIFERLHSISVADSFRAMQIPSTKAASPWL